MMKMKIMLAASILCAMTTTCAGAADMTDNMGNMAGFPPISSINIPKDDNIGSVTITADYIEKKGTPLIMMRGQERLPMNNAEA
mgnify:CR=1 FL=1